MKTLLTSLFLILSTTLFAQQDSVAGKVYVFKDMPQTLDADVHKDILTIRVTIIEKAEAQKVAEGIFSEIKKYPENYYIKTVMVVDASYNLLGYAGKK